jgi:hypothetical protein
MKALVLSLGAAAGLLGFAGTASAQWHHGHYHHGHGWGGGHAHFVPAHTHFHPDPWGGHVHVHPGRFVYHNGPDFIVPAYRGFGGHPGHGYGGFGYSRYRPGVSFGLTVIR